jgi:hypothetical protein
MRFLKGIKHKECKENAQQQCAAHLRYSSWLFSIPDELLLSRARFRFLISRPKLNTE